MDPMASRESLTDSREGSEVPLDKDLASMMEKYLDNSARHHDEELLQSAFLENDSFTNYYCSRLCQMILNSSSDGSELPQDDWLDVPGDDLSRIVDQVLDSIDPQFGDLLEAGLDNEGPQPSSEALAMTNEVSLCHRCGSWTTESHDQCQKCGLQLKNASESADQITLSPTAEATKICIVEPRVVTPLIKVRPPSGSSAAQVAPYGRPKEPLEEEDEPKRKQSRLDHGGTTEIPKLPQIKVVFDEEDEDPWLTCPQNGCHFWTRKAARMTRHTLSHTHFRGQYECPDCKLQICNLPKLLRHDRKCHTGYKDYECKICEAEVTDIAIHMRVHKSEQNRGSRCSVCGLQFRHANSLVRHLFRHSGEKRPFRCEDCHEDFHSVHRLRLHRAKAHQCHNQQQPLQDQISLAFGAKTYARIAPAPSRATALVLPSTSSAVMVPGVYLLNGSALPAPPPPPAPTPTPASLLLPFPALIGNTTFPYMTSTPASSSSAYFMTATQSAFLQPFPAQQHLLLLNRGPSLSIN